MLSSSHFVPCVGSNPPRGGRERRDWCVIYPLYFSLSFVCPSPGGSPFAPAPLRLVPRHGLRGLLITQAGALPFIQWMQVGLLGFCPSRSNIYIIVIVILVLWQLLWKCIHVRSISDINSMTTACRKKDHTCKQAKWQMPCFFRVRNLSEIVALQSLSQAINMFLITVSPESSFCEIFLQLFFKQLPLIFEEIF